MPGLWDAHVHFAYIEEMAPSMFDLFLAYGMYLASGIRGVKSISRVPGKRNHFKTLPPAHA